MTKISPLEQFKVPLGGQEIELQQVDYEGANSGQLRTRIRERSRFTVFDIDPLTARHWGNALLRWAEEQEIRAAQAGPAGTTEERKDHDDD
jgi:hypothetical protein